MRTAWKFAVIGLVIGVVGPSGATPADGLREVFSTTGKPSPRVAGYLRDLDRVSKSLPGERVAARLAGIPTRLSVRNIPEQSNAAREYGQLTELLKNKPLGKGADDLLSRAHRLPLSRADEAAVRALLQERRDVVELAHQAVAKPDCAFSRDWSRGIELELPEYSTVRVAVRILAAESVLLARSGRLEAALRNLALGFRAARHGESDGVLIAHLVGIASRGITLSGMASLLQIAGGDSTACSQIEASIASNQASPDLSRAFTHEAALLIHTLRASRNPGSSNPLPNDLAPAKRRLLAKLTDAWEADCLRSYRRALAAVRLPIARRRPAFRNLDRELHTATSNPVFFGRTLIFSFEDTEVAQIRLTANERLYRSAARLLLLRREQGRFPDTLPNGADHWQDPFTGKRLGYRKAGAGFTLFSVGKTGRYSGGTPASAEADRKAREIFFRYPVNLTRN